MSRLLTFAYRYLLGLGGCLYLLSLGMFHREHRKIFHEVTFRLGLRERPAPEPSGPPLEIQEVEAKGLIGDAPPVRVLEPDAADGNVTGFELLILAQLVAARKPKACFEIGTFDGRTTLNLAANAAEDAHVYTLDLPPEELGRTGLNIAAGDEKFIQKEASGVRFAGSEWADRITQLYGDSATFDFSPYEGRMDVVFIDGSHSYDYVKRDTETALKLVKPEGGLILWHDYGSIYWKDLTRALNELYAERPEFRSMRHVKDTVLVVWEGVR